MDLPIRYPQTSGIDLVCLNNARQIERDCEFLEAERIMDYSLLVGIHFRNDNTGDKMGLSPFVLRGNCHLVI